MFGSWGSEKEIFSGRRRGGVGGQKQKVQEGKENSGRFGCCCRLKLFEMETIKTFLSAANVEYPVTYL